MLCGDLIEILMKERATAVLPATPPGARRSVRIAVAILVLQVVIIGALAGWCLPLSEALLVTFLLELAGAVIWFVAVRWFLFRRFGIVLPLSRQW